MSKISLVVLMFIFGILAIVCGVSGPISNTTTFVNHFYSYRVEYPADWYFAGDAKRFYIHNFPSSQAVKGVVLPPAGAEINIIARAQSASGSKGRDLTLEEWATISTAKQDVTGRRVEEVTNGHTLRVIHITSKCCTRPPFIESHQWFFEVDGEFYRASLGFWENDKNQTTLFQVFRSVVLSLRRVD